jgi:hypothetical protein
MKPCAAREIEVDTTNHKHTFFLYLHLCRQRNERGTQQGIMYHPLGRRFLSVRQTEYRTSRFLVHAAIWGVDLREIA